MSQAIFTFTDRQSNQSIDTVVFDLLDNAGCRAWQYAVMLNANSRIVFPSSPIIFQPIRPPDVNDSYKKLKCAIEELASSDFAFTQAVPESFETVDQDFLNRLHRHFTSSVATMWYPKYAGPVDYAIDKVLHDINHLVHTLDEYVPNPTKLKYNRCSNTILALSHGQELSYDIFPFRKYHSYESADLILDSHILGKSLIESFACEDDPTSWDTAGHMRTNGGAIIQLDSFRQELYNSADFLDWLKKHGVEKNQKLADFPLGYFAPGQRSKLESLVKDLKQFSVELHIKL